MVPEGLIELYRQHVAKQFSFTSELLQDLGYESLVIAAGESKYHFRDDGEYPFKLNAYFAQWLNLSAGAGSYLILNVNKPKPVLYYYFPDDIWHKPSPIEQTVVHECFEVINFDDVKTVQRAVSSQGQLAGIGQSDVQLFDDRFDVNPPVLLKNIDYRRAYKTDYEQACIKIANDIAVVGHKAAAKSFFEGETEFQIQLAYLQATQQLEHEQPYDSIIALNRHAAVLHYPNKSKKAPEEHLSFLIDAGACCGGYASDISRTYSKGSGDFQNLIDAMNTIQLSLISALKPGTSYLDLHLLAHQKIAELLIESDIAMGSVEGVIEQGVSAVFFPHGLGHYLGIQVHDKGGYLSNPQGDELLPPAAHPYLRLTRSVLADQVFTIEPGLYFIEGLLEQAKSDNRKSMINWQSVERFMPYGGIRIEDNILLNESGPINLTRLSGLS